MVLMENVVVKDTPTMRVCPQCGINIARECVKCPACGLDVTGVQSYPLSADQLQVMHTDNARYMQQISNGKYTPASAADDTPTEKKELSDDTAAPKVNFCPMCGNRIKPGANCCSSCGHKL